MVLCVDGRQEPSSDEYPSHIKKITILKFTTTQRGTR